MARFRLIAVASLVLGLASACGGSNDPVTTNEGQQQSPGQNRCTTFTAVCKVDALTWCDENSGERSVNCKDVNAECLNDACRVPCAQFGKPRCLGTQLVTCRGDGVLQFDDCTQFGSNYGCSVSATLGEPVCQAQ